jgi:hypothetical protein
VRERHQSTRRRAEIAGTGTADIEVLFPVPMHSRLIAFNGGTKGETNGHFLAQAEINFADGTKIGPAKIVRACTPKG